MHFNQDLKILCSFIVTNQTEDDVDMLREIIFPYVDEYWVHPVREFFNQYPDDISYLKPKTINRESNKIPCVMVFNRIHITCDGFLSACCVDYNHDLLLADLKKITLKEAWESPNAVKLRQAHLQGQLEGLMCHGCVIDRYSPYSSLKV